MVAVLSPDCRAGYRDRRAGVPWCSGGQGIRSTMPCQCTDGYANVSLRYNRKLCLVSHNVVVAREYRVPCLVNVPTATQMFHSGIIGSKLCLVSHNVVVAREYGVPCLVNVPTATQMFHSGIIGS